jgi:hypothetical protein
MALTPDEVSTTKDDEVNSSSSDNKLPMEQEEVEHIDMPPVSPVTNEEQKQPSIESEKDLSSSEKSISIPSEGNLTKKRQNQFKARSVSFAPTVEEIEIPARHSSFSSRQPIDFIDALVESYKLEISNNSFPLKEEKQYIPKTTRTRLNPNWREHRIRRLMNKLEELSLWDREEELKVTQAQFLREQKLEQIQDRQRNHDLCLHLMRQRHESEMESAVLLDRLATGINDENTSATIARAMNLVSPANILAYDLPTPPYILKRRVRQDQEKIPHFKTPIGRYRQFETNMNNKLEKINQKLQPDWEIMRAYNPYHTSIPTTVSPLFSETYAALLSVPDAYSSNRYNQYHYGIASYLHHSPQHASSPDYETRVRAHSNRDVRVPLKEEANDNNNDNDADDDYNNSRLSSNLSRRPTNSILSPTLSLYDYSPLPNTSREYSLIHSRQPLSNSIHQRSLNDDLNAITQYSVETGKNILRNITKSSNGVLTKIRSSSLVPTNKRVTFIDQGDDNDEENYNYSKASRIIYQPELISLSSTR